MENLKILSNSLLNSKSIATMLIPVIGYIYLTEYLGLWAATICLAIYSLVIDWKFEFLGKFSYVLVLSALLEIAITLWLPDTDLVDALAIKTQIYAIKAAVVLIVFSLLKNPIPMLFAEAFSPSLIDIRRENRIFYLRIWQTISLVWVLACVFKVVVFQFYHYFNESQYVLIKTLFDWPLGIGLAYFSIAYSRKKFLALS